MALRLTEAQVGLLKVDTINSRTASTALYMTGGYTVYISSASNASLIMRTGTTEVARVSAKGNFIIGAEDVTTTDYKLKVTGATGFASGHLYLTGANATSASSNTTQLVFGEPGNNHVAISSNNNAIVINPTSSTTTNQIVLDLDEHSLFPTGLKTISTTNSTSATTGSIITSGGIGVAKSIFSTGRYTSNQAGARYIVNNNTLNGWFGFSENGESFGIYDVTNGYYLIRNTTLTTGGGVSLGSASQHTTILGNLTVNKNTTINGSLTHTGQYFYQSGDATMKFYPQTNTTYGSESVAIQTCFDNQDGSSSDYVTAYENRCNLLLQPRGGQVYIGINHTAIGDTTNSLIVSGNAKITNLLTTGSGANHYGVKVGDTYINAIDGNLIFQNNSAIRFGGDSWDYNIWAGLKYVHSSKTISLGLADGSVFTANAAQSGGTLALPGIRYFSVNGKRVLDANDTWLRINEGNAFSAGIYFGTSLVRTDGQLQVGSSGSAFYAKSDGTGYFKSDLKVDGKLIMTGNIAYTNGGNQYDVVRFVTGDVNGAGLILGGGGVVIIGSGESAYNFQGSSGANIAGTTETTYITSDNGIEFYTNCQTIGNRVGVILNTSRAFYPNANNAGSLGTTSYKWGSGHFYGAVNAGHVWASNQTGGEADVGVNFASGKHLYLYGNNSSGSRGLYDTNKGTVISVTDSAASFNGSASSAGYLTSNITFTPAETALTPANVKSLIGSGSQIRKGTWHYAGNGYIPSGSTATTQCPFGAIDLAGTTVIQSTTGTEYTQIYITPPTANTSGAIKGEMLYYIDQGSGYSPTWYRVLTNNNYSSYALPLSGGTMSANAVIKFPATAGTIATSDPMAITYGRIAAYGTLCINANTDNSGTEYVILTAGKGHSNSTADGLAVGTSTLTWQNATVVTSSNYSSWMVPKSGGTFTGKVAISYAHTGGGMLQLMSTSSNEASIDYAAGGTSYWVVGKGCGGTGNTTFAWWYNPGGGNVMTLTSAGVLSTAIVGASTRIYTGYDSGVSGSVSCSNWFRSSGDTGWYNASYGGGWYQSDSTYIRTHGTFQVYSPGRYLAGDIPSSWYNGLKNQAAYRINACSDSDSYHPWIQQTNTSSGYNFSLGMLGTSFYMIGCSTSQTNNYYDAGLVFNVSNGYLTGPSRVYGAVWNDYAEYRSAETTEPGRVVQESANGIMKLTVARLQAGCEIISDTFGFAIGETDNCKTPVAASGRVLAYTFEDRDSFELGQAVCSGPNGTVSKMTREEIMMYPERIIGTVSEIPNYETWGSGNVPINGRIWIRIR